MTQGFFLDHLILVILNLMFPAQLYANDWVPTDYDGHMRWKDSAGDAQSFWIESTLRYTI